MTKHRQPQILDHELGRYDTAVLQAKFTQAAEYVRGLEERSGRLRLMLNFLERHKTTPDISKTLTHLPSFIDAVNLSLGVAPSLIAADIELLKKDTRTTIAATLVRNMVELRRLSGADDSNQSPTSPEAALANIKTKLALYVDCAVNYLALYCDLRDLYESELNGRHDKQPISPRARDRPPSRNQISYQSSATNGQQSRAW